MKLFLSTLLITLIAISFSGCDGIIEAEVKLSELENTKVDFIYSDLFLEVSACNNYEDSRKLSDDHIKSKETIPKIFLKAKYIECFSKEFDTYVHFKIPIILAKSHEVFSDDFIQFTTTKKELLSVLIPSKIKRKLDKFEDETFTKINLKMNIKFINDTNKDLDFSVLSVYLNDQPYLSDTFSSRKNNSFSLRLSDVSIDNALNNGITKVMLY